MTIEDKAHLLALEFERTLSFQLDQFQMEAIEALAQRRSVLVTAPTATGKTLIAEFAIWDCLGRGLRSVYTTPIKALSNQKFRDFRRTYGKETVGLMTGDIVENPQAPVVVMTTEVLRNLMLQDRQSVAEVGVVVFDEIHYLADPERGTTWEEALIECPHEVQLVCLSATVGNAAELAAWLSSLRPVGDLVHVNWEKRAVPLEHRFLVEGNLTPFLSADGRVLRRFKVGGELTRRPSRRGPTSFNSRSQRVLDIPSPSDVVRLLERQQLLPAIYFFFSRRATEAGAEQCAGFAPSEHAEANSRALATVLEKLPESDHSLEQIRLLQRLLPRGVAFHHAGMLPALKVLVEDLLVEGKLRVVFATDTLSLGINAPARSVVIGDLSKFDGISRRVLAASEYRQLTGRAGRRGMDERGVAVVLYSPWVEFDQVLRMANGPLEPLESAFRPGYSTAANLWLQGDAERRLTRLVAMSLRRFQRQGDVEFLTSERAELKQALDEAMAQPLADGRPRKKVRTLSAALAAADAELQEAQEEAGRAGRRTIGGLRNVLERYGYLSKGKPLPAMHRLSRLFDANALTLAEVIGRGWLADLQPAELSEFAAWFSHDREGAERVFNLPRRMVQLREQTMALHLEIMAVEKRHGLALSTPLSLDLTGLVWGWANDATLHECCRRGRLAEGDFVMLVQKTIDLLGQLRSAAREEATPAAASLSVSLKEAAYLLRRGVIASTYALILGEDETPPEEEA